MPSGDSVRRAALITHGNPEAIGPAFTRVRRVAESSGVELLVPDEEAEKHGIEQRAEVDIEAADVAVVLGGDGTMLRALQRFLGSQVPVLGVNFGSVGFLTAMPPDELETGLARVFAGEYRVLELATLQAEAGEASATAVNDVVATSSTLGRMARLSWAVGGEDAGTLACDGVICSTPAGSTGYNLSNGGPVMVWGLDALAVTFIAPHSLQARPLVVPRSRDVVVANETADVPVTVLADGHPIAQLGTGDRVVVRLGPERSLLGTLPESTFFSRYRKTFAS